MSDALTTTITKLINSPPGQLAAGGVLAGIVWKFFKNVGDVLNESTNREIARWIRVKSFETGIVADEAGNWPNTFAKVFDHVFGTKHLSWFCFERSVTASCLASMIGYILAGQDFMKSVGGREFRFRSLVPQDFHPGDLLGVLAMAAFLFAGNVLPDYVSLLVTRYILSLARRCTLTVVVLLLLADGFATVIIASIPLCVVTFISVHDYVNQINHISAIHSPEEFKRAIEFIANSDFPPDLRDSIVRLLVEQRNHESRANLTKLRLVARYGMKPLGFAFVLPAFFTSIWLWLYAGSGFILKAARRFDIGFDWFSRKVDIEKKPLQSMGLVSGVLVAVVYWAAVIVEHILD